MSDDDNKPRKKPLNRRSFMASILGGAAVAGGASSLIAGEAQAPQRLYVGLQRQRRRRLCRSGREWPAVRGRQ